MIIMTIKYTAAIASVVAAATHNWLAVDILLMIALM